METGRQLAMQMSVENPEIFQSIRRQMETQGGGGGGEQPNPDNTNTDNQDPPNTHN